MKKIKKPRVALEARVDRFSLRMSKVRRLRFEAAEIVLAEHNAGTGVMSDTLNDWVDRRMAAADAMDKTRVDEVFKKLTEEQRVAVPKNYEVLLQRPSLIPKSPHDRRYRIITPEDLPEGYKEDAPIPLEPFKRKPA